jgi:hypothetical protein
MPRLRVQVGGLLAATGTWSNTLEFFLSGAISSQATLQSIANATFTALTADASFKAGFCADTTFKSVKMLYYPTNTPPAALVAESAGSPVYGSAAAIHAPQVCAVASLRTGTAGRSYRGRTYVPYRGASISSAGVLTSTAQGIVNTYVQRIVTQVATALGSASISAAWVVWSEKLGTGSAVASVLVGTQCDTQRHRNDNRDESYASYAPPSVVVSSTDQAEVDRLNAILNEVVPGISAPPAGFTDVLGIIAGAVLTDGEESAPAESEE